MHDARSILTVLFLLGSLGGAKPAIASENTSPMAVKANSAPLFQVSQEANVLRQVAIALAAGSEAMGTLRGSPIADDNRDKLQPVMPGMDCGIDRSLSYVACYSASLDNQKEAEAVFTRLIDDVQAALPSGSWRPVEAVPDTGSVRSVSYQDQKSSAKIDVDLVAQPTLDTPSSYFVRLFGWTGF
jgi:hypothetical protein